MFGREAPLAHMRLADKGDVPLAKLVADIRQEMISSNRHWPYSPDIMLEDYQAGPRILKEKWNHLGTALRRCEVPDVAVVSGNRWLTVRCDGTGFSKLITRFRKAGILKAGFAPEFGEIMRECVTTVMAKLHGVIGYTQSDEMTIMFPPRRLNKEGHYIKHPFDGRVFKLCSQVASEVTAIFNFRILEIARTKGLQWSIQHLPTFDCRVGSFAHADEAMALIMWRAYDCGVNGVSDAVHHTGNVGKHIKEQSTVDKLVWLKEQRLLPLNRHQAYGSLFSRRGQKEIELVNVEDNSNVNMLLKHVVWSDPNPRWHKTQESEWFNNFLTILPIKVSENTYVSHSNAGVSNFAPADRVGITGLQCSPEINGRQGQIVRFIAEAGRYEVQIDGMAGTKLVSSTNLLRLQQEHR